MATTTIELPPDMQRDLEALARRTGRTEAELIVEAVERRLVDERHLPAGKRPLPRSIGVVSAPDVSGADYEAWLKATWHPEDDWRRE